MEEVIYALVDPRDGLEFYVGRTQDIYKRFMQHISYEKSNDAKRARIQELKSLHLLPIMKTLEVVKDDTALAAQREAYWIRHFRHLGIELTNDVVYSTARIPEEGEENTKKSPLTLKGYHRSMSTKDAAEFLGCTDRQVRRLRVNGVLVADESGRITAASVKAYKKRKEARAG
jgi:predicted GIY-YIG superfamily endonuclease